jgi:hypothetical protein
MSLKSKYYGQQDGTTVPDQILTGNPGTDQITLINAGYLGGRVMALHTSATAGRGSVIVPCDAGAGFIPFGFLLNGPGEFAGAIGPSGSGKAPITRALGQFYVDSQAYDATATFVVGAPVFCGAGAKAGLLTATALTAGAGVFTAAIGIVTQIPTATEPWLGVSSLL